MTIIIKKVEKNLGKITILIIYSLVVFYFMVNGEGLFSEWGTGWTFNAIIYVVGVALFLSVTDELPKELKTSFYLNLIYFCVASSLSIAFLLLIKDLGFLFNNIAPMSPDTILPNLVFQLVVVASSEEIIFRGIIFGYLYDRFKLRSERVYGWMIPYFGSALIFSSFHYAVYGLDIANMATIFIMGLIFAYCVERWGIGTSIGIHWIWNCMAIGIFSIPPLL